MQPAPTRRCCIAFRAIATRCIPIRPLPPSVASTARSYGFTGRGLLHLLCGSDPARFTSMEGRFSSPVLPGETLTVNAWVTGDGEAVFQTHGDDGRVVLDAGRLTYLGA